MGDLLDWFLARWFSHFSFTLFFLSLLLQFTETSSSGQIKDSSALEAGVLPAITAVLPSAFSFGVETSFHHLKRKFHPSRSETYDLSKVIDRSMRWLINSSNWQLSLSDSLDLFVRSSHDLTATLETRIDLSSDHIDIRRAFRCHRTILRKLLLHLSVLIVVYQ